jgi:hypothetical protein
MAIHLSDECAAALGWFLIYLNNAKKLPAVRQRNGEQFFYWVLSASI